MMSFQTNQVLVADHQRSLREEALTHRLRRQVRAEAPESRRRRRPNR